MLVVEASKPNGQRGVVVSAKGTVMSSLTRFYAFQLTPASITPHSPSHSPSHTPPNHTSNATVPAASPRRSRKRRGSPASPAARPKRERVRDMKTDLEQDATPTQTHKDKYSAPVELEAWLSAAKYGWGRRDILGVGAGGSSTQSWAYMPVIARAIHKSATNKPPYTQYIMPIHVRVCVSVCGFVVGTRWWLARAAQSCRSCVCLSWCKSCRTHSSNSGQNCPNSTRCVRIKTCQYYVLSFGCVVCDRQWSWC